MALSTSNRRRLISNSTKNNINTNSSTPSSYNSTKLTRRLANSSINNNNNTPSDSSSSTSVNRAKLNKTPVTSSAINKEKRLIQKQNGYLSGTMSTVAKSKKHNQNGSLSASSTLSSKKAKLLNKSSHMNSKNATPLNSKLKSFNKENGLKSHTSKKLLLSNSKPLKGNQKQQEQQQGETSEMLTKGEFDLGEEMDDAQSLFDFSSKEEFVMSEQVYEQRLKKLLEQLTELNQLKQDSPLLIDETRRLERESNENLLVSQTLYEKHKNDIEQQFSIEYNKAIQEFHDKRREIKESLRNEHDEMRKQIEIDRNCLDINTDITETKPLPSRNLRRRNNALNNTTHDFNADTDADSSVLIQSNVMSSLAVGGVSLLGANLSVSNSATSMILGQFTNAAANNLTSHANTINGFYSSMNNGGLNNSLNQTINDRKRKLIPSTITFAINDDELNEDYKFLVKNLNNHTLAKQPLLDSAKSSTTIVS